VSHRQSKQLRLVPFPSYQADTDVAMSDALSDVSSLEPVTSEQQHHMRLNSGASTSSSSDYGDGTSLHTIVIVSTHCNVHIATAFPSFAIPPNPFFGSDGSVDVDSHNFSRFSDSPPPRRSVGLLEPKNNFLHHGLVPSIVSDYTGRETVFFADACILLLLDCVHRRNCTQIPKLRMACASNSHGQRSMWSHCEQCGAIEMMDPDY